MIQDVQTADIQVQVCIFGFDLIYLNGQVKCQLGLATAVSYIFDKFHFIGSDERTFDQTP